MDDEEKCGIRRSLDEGLRAGDENRHHLTFHPRGGDDRISVFPSAARSVIPTGIIACGRCRPEDRECCRPRLIGATTVSLSNRLLGFYSSGG